MRKPIIVGSTVIVTLALAGIALLAQQDKSSRPSPPAKAECKLQGGKGITIDYSSPRAKGRKIFGALVPYGQIWRAGANESTTFVVGSDKWTLVISKKTGEWGTAYPGPDNDLARIDMKVSKLSSPVENFTIAFDQAGGGCALKMEWETTQASVDIKK